MDLAAAACRLLPVAAAAAGGKNGLEELEAELVTVQGLVSPQVEECRTRRGVRIQWQSRRNLQRT